MSIKALEIAQKLEQRSQMSLKLSPSWSEDKRAMSKNLARTALFGLREKGKDREQYDNALLASVDGIEIRYTGAQLDQDDHTVFMQLCHLARDENIGSEIRITGAQALAGLKWSDSQEDYERLRSSYRRMLEGTVWLSVRKPGAKNYTQIYGTHLFGSVKADAANTLGLDSVQTNWTIKLNLELANLLTGSETTLIKWAAEQKMSPLANWLHRFFATHDTTEAPAVFKAETLHRLCRSKRANMASWRQSLKRALDELQEVGFIASWSIGPPPAYNVSVINRTLKEIDADPRWRR
jgi:hypothetical protein